MNVALAAALRRGDLRERFEARVRPFNDLEGADVPPEFEED